MTTSTSTAPTVVIVPGLRDHVADHWQTLLAERLDTVRTVPPLEQDKLSLAARVAALDAVVADIDGPVVLVAHSAGVAITVHWAQQSTRPVQGACWPPPHRTSRNHYPRGIPPPRNSSRVAGIPSPRRRLAFPQRRRRQHE